MKIGNIYMIGLFLSLLLFAGCSDDDSRAASAEPKLSLSAESIEVGQEVILKLIGVSAEDIRDVQWELGDGSVSEKMEVTHHYEAPGTYTVSVSATLGDGKSWAAKGVVEVHYPEVTESQRPSITASLQNREHVQICAHRGYWKDAPENSVMAVALAIGNKIDMIELDVRMTKDGELILMHDADIDRTTNGSGKVSELSYKELSSYNLYHNDELTEERIPLFKDILSAARGKIYIDIDVKISDYKAVYDLIKEYGMLSQAMFTVYDVATAKRVVALDKNILQLPVIYEMQDLENYLAVCKPLPVAQFNSDAFTDDILAKASENGVFVFKNIYINTSITPTSDNYKQVKAFLAKKGSIIQTDYPVELKEYLKNN